MRKFLLIGAFIALALLVMCSATGCSLGERLAEFQADNPELSYKSVDEDGDGTPDTYLITDKQGNVVKDPKTGKPREVPGARKMLARAGDTDASLALLLKGLGGASGVSVLGLIGYWVGRLKPTKRVTHLTTLWRGLVKSVQQVRTSPDMPEGALALINRILSESQREVAGLERAVAEAKAELKDAGGA